MTLQQLADKRHLTEEAWQKLRRSGIGGSDAAAVLGSSPYRSALAVYYEKVAGTRQNTTLAMELGKELKPFLRRKCEQWLQSSEGQQIQVQEVPFMLQNTAYPHMFAHLDGRFTHPQLGPCGLLLKTTNEFQRSAWEEEKVPAYCYIQLQHCMAVTGLQQFYVLCLIGNRLLSAHMVPRQEKVIQNLAQQLKAFWQQHVLPKVPPAPAGLPCDTSILKTLYPAEEESVVALHHCQKQYDRYQELKQQEKKLKQEMEALRQHFMAEMKEARTALVGRQQISWKIVERRGYTVAPSATRVLRIT